MSKTGIPGVENIFRKYNPEKILHYTSCLNTTTLKPSRPLRNSQSRLTDEFFKFANGTFDHLAKLGALSHGMYLVHQRNVCLSGSNQKQRLSSKSSSMKIQHKFDIREPTTCIWVKLRPLKKTDTHTHTHCVVKTVLCPAFVYHRQCIT